MGGTSRKLLLSELRIRVDQSDSAIDSIKNFYLIGQWQY